LVVVARVGLRFVGAKDANCSFLRACEGVGEALESSTLERNGFEVKKCRRRGRLAGVVR